MRFRETLSAISQRLTRTWIVADFSRSDKLSVLSCAYLVLCPLDTVCGDAGKRVVWVGLLLQGWWRDSDPITATAFPDMGLVSCTCVQGEVLVRHIGRLDPGTDVTKFQVLVARLSNVVFQYVPGY